MSLSTNVSNLATRIATEVKAIRTLVNGNVADLSALTTTEKTNLVGAINELKDILGSGVSDMAGSTVSDKLSSINAKIGDTMMLPSGSTDLVDAINDLKTLIDNLNPDLTALIDDTTTATDKVWSSSKVSAIFGSTVSGTAGQTVSDQIGSLYNTIGDTMMYPGGFTSVVDELQELKGLIDNIDLTGYATETYADGVGTSANTGNTVVRRDQAGGFSATGVEVTSLSLDTLQGSVVSSSQGTLELGNTNQTTTINGSNVNLNVISDVNVMAQGNFVVQSAGAYLNDSQSDSSKIATQGYVDATINDGIPSETKVWSSYKTNLEIGNAVAAVVDLAPAALDTLNELAAALGDDANYAATITTALSGKADAQHSHAISDVTGLQEALDAKASSANVGDTTVNYVTTFEAGLV